MAEPRGAQAAARGPAPRLERTYRWQRSSRHSALAAAKKLADRRHRHARVAQTRHHRVDVAEALARPARRGLDALEARASRVGAERLHLGLDELEYELVLRHRRLGRVPVARIGRVSEEISFFGELEAGDFDFPANERLLDAMQRPAFA